MATPHHKRMVEKHKAKLKELEKRRLAGLVALAEQINKQSINVEANANDEGHLYGSVGPHEIVVALKQAGIQITDDQVRLCWSVERAWVVYGQDSTSSRSCDRPQIVGCSNGL